MSKFIEGFKAKCVKSGTEITTGKSYTIIDVAETHLIVLSDENRNYRHPVAHFEVIEDFCPCCLQEVQDLSALKQAELFELMKEFTKQARALR